MRLLNPSKVALVVAVALTLVAPASASAETDPAVSLAMRIAEAVAEGQCPAPGDLAAVTDFYRAGPAESLGVVYEELHDRVRLHGLPYSVVWQAATTAPAVTEASEAMRRLTACFGVPEFNAESYKAMLDTITAYINAAAASATSKGKVVLPSVIGMLVTTTREILSGLPGRKTASLSVEDSLAGDFEVTLEAAGQYDGEDVVDTVGGPSQSSLADNPVAATTATSSRVSAVLNDLVLGKDKKGYTRISERVYVHDWLSGLTLFTIDNTITWRWNYTKRYVEGGQAFDNWNISLVCAYQSIRALGIPRLEAKPIWLRRLRERPQGRG